jgi:C-terminal processing protease CtpA/Prc
MSYLRILDLAALDEQLARAVVTRGLALRNIDNQVVVTRIVDGSPAARAGLRQGFLLQAIDGVPDKCQGC